MRSLAGGLVRLQAQGGSGSDDNDNFRFWFTDRAMHRDIGFPI
jgi:hypothetical protein